ncbi:Spo0B domain-containing protein [Paenibacillus sp. GCM10027626]|uniref:Spo0B domain-containing protein n=1 Tax=Paenibacillus sp. GCM10027626 TaxID=3273411 RepID=UPI0036428182
MNRIRIIKQYTAASILLPMVAVLIWRSELWLLAVLVGWLTCAAVVWIGCERKEHAYRMSKMMQSMQMTMIRTLNHHRHDWMNDLQVLYGYIRMGKTEKMVQCVEQIRDNMQCESKIAKLGIPSLITYIQSFRTVANGLQLNVRIRDEIDLSQLPIDGEKLAAGIIEIINAYRFGVKSSMGDVPKLTLEFTRFDDALQVGFLFDGELNDENEWQQKWKQRLKGTPLQPLGKEHKPGRLTLQAELGK